MNPFKKVIKLLCWLFAVAMIPLAIMAIIFVIFIMTVFSDMVYDGPSPHERLQANYNDYMQVVKIFKSGKWPYEIRKISAETRALGHYDNYVLPSELNHLVRSYMFSNPKKKLFTIEGDINNPNSEILFPVLSSYYESLITYTPVEGCGEYKPCIKGHWYISHSHK